MTKKYEPFYFEVEIIAPDATDEDVDKMARQLLTEVRRIDVDSVSLVKNNDVPAGTKAVDAVMIGTVAISIIPTALEVAVDVIKAWSKRREEKVSVKFKGRVGGQMINFEGSREDLEKIITKLAKVNK